MDPADQLPPPGRCPARVYRPRNAGLRRILAACYVPDGVADGERWHLGRMHSDFGAADTTDTARLGPASCPAAQRLSGRSRAVPVGGSVTARLRSWAPARRHRPRAAGAAIALFVLLVSAACTSTADPDLPSTAYRHEPLQETSVAGPATASGDTAVLDQLQEARRTGQGFTGPVSGVLLVIDPAQPALPDDGSFAQSFRVQIGAPLIGVR